MPSNAGSRQRCDLVPANHGDHNGPLGPYLANWTRCPDQSGMNPAGMATSQPMKAQWQREEPSRRVATGRKKKKARFHWQIKVDCPEWRYPMIGTPQRTSRLLGTV